MRQTLCVLVLAPLGLAVATLGQEKEPPKPEAGSKVVKEQIRGQWRAPDDRLLRITGKVQVLDAHTILYEDGTVVGLNGGMDAPDLGQKGVIGDVPYPCGREAAEFLKKLIGDQPVMCYSDSGGPVDTKKIGRADAFVGETNLNIEMVRNGWALSHHSGMDAWEAIAREYKRGLWRGTFVIPERWRKGERLPEEKCVGRPQRPEPTSPSPLGGEGVECS
jgi:endonuclease YncB( thermonuclease family)